MFKASKKLLEIFRPVNISLFISTLFSVVQPHSESQVYKSLRLSFCFKLK